mgnify:CR=1 FL=1
MVPKGSSPETYDPTPQQLVNLDKSTAYLRIGYIGFEQAWMDKLTSNAPHLKVFDTSKGIDLSMRRTQPCDHHRLLSHRSIHDESTASCSHRPIRTATIPALAGKEVA